MNSKGFMVVFWLAIFIAAVSVSAHLHDSNDISVSWKSDDVIDNQVFMDRYKDCTDHGRITGFQFKDCLIDSYNLALEN